MRYLFHSIHTWELQLFLQVSRHYRSKLLSRFFVSMSRSADGYLYPLVPALLWLCGFQEAGPFLLAGLIAFAIELPIYGVLKKSIRRNRPFETHARVRNRIKPPDRFSFPSGHTAAAFIMLVLVAAYLPLLALPLIPWALAVGASRVYLGVHYPTDVLAGMVLGISAALMGLLVELKIHLRRIALHGLVDLEELPFLEAEDRRHQIRGKSLDQVG